MAASHPRESTTMIEAFSGPRYRENSERAGHLHPCVICGRKITAANPHWLRVDTSNRFHAMSEKLTVAQDMGCYPIGADCLRQHPDLKPLAERWPS